MERSRKLLKLLVAMDISPAVQERKKKNTSEAGEQLYWHSSSLFSKNNVENHSSRVQADSNTHFYTANLSSQAKITSASLWIPYPSIHPSIWTEGFIGWKFVFYYLSIFDCLQITGLKKTDSQPGAEKGKNFSQDLISLKPSFTSFAFALQHLTARAAGQKLEDGSDLPQDRCSLTSSSTADKLSRMAFRSYCTPHFKPNLYPEEGNGWLLSQMIKAQQMWGLSRKRKKKKGKKGCRPDAVICRECNTSVHFNQSGCWGHTHAVHRQNAHSFLLSEAHNQEYPSCIWCFYEFNIVPTGVTACFFFFSPP